MITFSCNVFRLSTRSSSYWLRVSQFKHLEHVYYGSKLPDEQAAEPLVVKRNAQIGCSVNYSVDDSTYSLDTLCLEWSDIGRGDYRSIPSEIVMPDGTFTSDFVYKSHQITKGYKKPDTLPSAYGDEDDCQTLELTMIDESNNVTLLLYYTVYEKTNVITRRAVIENGNKESLTLRKLMSMSVDLPNDGFRLITFNGGWIKEANKFEREITHGIHINSSTTGASSNRSNPGFLVAASGTTQSSGNVYGFNLVYSGNHYGVAELSSRDIVRIQTGINPHCFNWKLAENERFETPEAIMSFSADGFNGLSHNFHDFINNHIVRSDWKNKERPIVLNNWEAHFFKFNREKLLNLARRASKIGVELFVLDDGWFGARNSDKAGLGDYEINKKKLPQGLEEFSRRIHSMGMKFGLWFEPEMVNEDSDLYRAHPEYALQTKGKKAVKGRNQLVLDLCNPKVRDYIVENVTRILDTCDINYVKWDFNRHISDACSAELNDQGRFFHTYIMGLYEVLDRIFTPRPHILFESCASGGNRFDAGMLCFSPQVWTSDNTDPIERLKIQGGLSYLYPLSSMGAHVSEAPHQQTLRETPIATRFNVAAFGCLGYELDLKYLSHEETEEVKEQIEFYKQHRRIFQYGKFYRGEKFKDNKVVWHCVARRSSLCATVGGSLPQPIKKQTALEAVAITGFFQTEAVASESFDRLRLMGLDPNQKYKVTTHQQRLFIKRFGGLAKHILPVTLNPEGAVMRTINKYYSLKDCVETQTAYGKALMDGIMINTQYQGTGYNDKTRLPGDFGSNLYVVDSVEVQVEDCEGESSDG